MNVYVNDLKKDALISSCATLTALISIKKNEVSRKLSAVNKFDEKLCHVVEDCFNDLLSMLAEKSYMEGRVHEITKAEDEKNKSLDAQPQDVIEETKEVLEA